jgi:hypothetical protein
MSEVMKKAILVSMMTVVSLVGSSFGDGVSFFKFYPKQWRWAQVPPPPDVFRWQRASTYLCVGGHWVPFQSISYDQFPTPSCLPGIDGHQPTTDPYRSLPICEDDPTMVPRPGCDGGCLVDLRTGRIIVVNQGSGN